MTVNILTKEDLHQFKAELLQEIQTLVTENAPAKLKKWLKSYEVCKTLGISRGTLQTLRDNGTLPSTLIGGLVFYDYDDILQLMKPNKSASKDFRK
ncbi:MAG: DNA-binding protein [Chitinophagaceae bacterium]|nr:MAG: DNA-binding protein [Chitinophagaceae bacterium]